MITVRQEGNYKLVEQNGRVQSIIGVEDTPLHTNGAWEQLIPNNNPKTVLILGLGGGTVAKEILKRYPKTIITGVDIDQEILDVAQNECGEERISYICEDCFSYVGRERKKYDYILVDVVKDNYIPLGVLDGVFFDQVTNLLSPTGVLCLRTYDVEKIATHSDFPMEIIRDGNDLIFKYKPK